MGALSRKTYAIDDDGPYEEDELREKIRAYCDEHGFHAALTLTVNEVAEDGRTGRPVDLGKYLG
jgi:hypothetical protein